MTRASDLIAKLDACPIGSSGWKEFEDVCIEILTHLFVPPLSTPKIQPRTLSGVQRRDAVFPNRNISDTSNNWGRLYKELDARMVLFEFKNYDSSEIGKEEVDQARSYMREHTGRLAIIVCNKEPHASAYRERLTIFNAKGKEVILFVTIDHLKEMLHMKERGEDPSDLIYDLLEWMYLQQE